jgi:hypothetical protein
MNIFFENFPQWRHTHQICIITSENKKTCRFPISNTMQRHNLFVITGGNRGFGLAIANALEANQEPQHLTTIILVGRDPSSLEKVATSLNGPRLQCYSISNAELDNVDTIDKVILPGIWKVVEVCTEQRHSIAFSSV